jgi:hypothetical protein
MKSLCPKRRVNTSTAPDFAAALCSNREYLGGEAGECEKAVVLKGASAIGSQLWGEVFTPEEGGHISYLAFKNC